MLPAITAASASGVAELLKLAPEIIRISLRLGIENSRRAQNLEQSLNSWACVVSGVSLDRVRDELQQFHESQVGTNPNALRGTWLTRDQTIPIHRQAYISVAAASSVTISGPPSTLKLLFDTPSSLSHARRNTLHLTAAYHASHLDVCNIDGIIGTSTMLDRRLAPNTSIISTSSGQVIGENRNMREALYEALFDILQHPIDWSLIMQSLTSFSKEMEITLSVIGPTSATSSVERALRPSIVSNLAGNALSDGDIHLFEHRPASEAIAIVGMSGRFPKGESLEEFWRVLEDGHDLHKEVLYARFNR